MSRAHATILVAILAIGLAVVVGGQPTTGPAVFSELHRAEVAGESDLEAVMGVIERHGESMGAKHYHPGGEFGFVLEGTAIVAREGEPEATLMPGSSFYQPPGEWHAVGTGSQGAKTVVFRLLKKGEPMMVAVE